MDASGNGEKMVDHPDCVTLMSSTQLLVLNIAHFSSGGIRGDNTNVDGHRKVKLHMLNRPEISHCWSKRVARLFRKKLVLGSFCRFTAI